MNAQRWRLRLWISLFGTALVLSGCATLDYRDIQRDFNAAVQADNVRTAEALGALTSSNAEQLYDDIRVRLTDERIRKLDDRLRPNAHAIRAVAEWRSGRLAEARATALAGLKLPNAASSPRDEMVLETVPAIVIDEELVARFKQAGSSLTKTEYEDRYVRDFATATDTMKKVAASARPSTPDSIVAYLHLQRWRILQNWRVVISKIQDGPEAREAARQDAAQRLGASLDAEIKRIEELIPAEDPLRKAMDAIRLR